MYFGQRSDPDNQGYTFMLFIYFKHLSLLGTKIITYEPLTFSKLTTICTHFQIQITQLHRSELTRDRSVHTMNILWYYTMLTNYVDYNIY